MPHLRGVPQPVQVAHLQLGVGQGYRLVKQLDSTLQVAALNLNIKGLKIKQDVLLNVDSSHEPR